MAGNSSTLVAIKTAYASRTGAPTGGISKQNGTGAQTVFNIAHGQGATPTSYWVMPVSEHAWSKKTSVTATSTNIVVTFPNAPASGTNNVQFRWGASRL